MKKVLKVLTIKNCQECPHVYEAYAGQGNYSYYCTKTRREANCIVYNCENNAEKPQNYKFPKWCPLKDK